MVWGGGRKGEKDGAGRRKKGWCGEEEKRMVWGGGKKNGVGRRKKEWCGEEEKRMVVGRRKKEWCGEEEKRMVWGGVIRRIMTGGKPTYAATSR